jgi:hypothetical protein
MREALSVRLLAVCFGAGVDSTAMLVALRWAGITPDVITFADTGGEKPETLDHVTRMMPFLWRGIGRRLIQFGNFQRPPLPIPTFSETVSRTKDFRPLRLV